MNIFKDNINIHTPSVAMPKDYAIAILNFLSQGKGIFHLFNPMDFWIVNLLCLNDGENLSQDENDFWIKCIISSWKSKFIIQNVLQEYEKFFSQNKMNIEQDIVKRRLKD